MLLPGCASVLRKTPRMFNVCPACGVYAAEKAIDPAGPFAVCPTCGYRHPFHRLPLFVVTGASGAGKSTVCLTLPERLPECVTLEMDILWRPEFNRPDDDYRAFRDVWLRIAKNVGQSGRPVVLGGSAVPGQFERCSEARYFAAIYYLALVCDDETLAARLRARPAWRESAGDDFVGRMLAFNGWLKENATTSASPARPQLDLLDTTSLSPIETVERVATWVRGCAGATNSVR